MDIESLKNIESGVWIYPISPGSATEPRLLIAEYTDQMVSIDARVIELESQLQQATHTRDQYLASLPESTGLTTEEVQEIQTTSQARILQASQALQVTPQASPSMPDQGLITGGEGLVTGEGPTSPQLAGFSPWMIFLLAGGAVFMLFGRKGIKGKEREKK